MDLIERIPPPLNIRKHLKLQTNLSLRSINLRSFNLRSFNLRKNFHLRTTLQFITFSILFLSLTLPSSTSHYVNKWSLQVEGGLEKVKEIARKHGFELVDEVLPGVWEIVHHKVKRVSHRPSHPHHHLLNNEQDVLWHQQLTSLQRQKRDYFTDPDWPKQWYMNQGKEDMRVLGNYDLYKMTGRGVVVTILDDGLEFNHTDLAANYDPEASYDFNDNDSDPFPRYEFTNFNRHGTRCAGEVAAVANNSKCGVGIAYNSKIGGIRILDGQITDTAEARSLYYHNQHIHIYSASWGPTDNGKIMEGPGRVTQKAMELGVTKGRGGLGSIFVWASGNGGRDGDNCNCDGYTSNVFTISVSSSGKNGDIPSYNERCSSTLATTYSSGSNTNYNDPDIVTTDLHNKCTDYHSGTSASAPMAAAIFALVLEASPFLTWRDMQYLVVLTSHRGNLQTPDWTKNSVGRYVSHHFGYGLLDAEEIVKAAEDWVTLPEHVVCVVAADFEPVNMTEYSNVSIDLTIQECSRTNLTIDLYKFHQRKTNESKSVDIKDSSDKALSNKKVKFLEHVQALVTLESTRRGQVEILLTSPQGTVSELLSVRSKDKTSKGIHEWPFTTVHSWGERSEGLWKLTVLFHECTGTLSKWSLMLYGTEEDPLKKVSYPPRVLKPTEKTCDPDEFYLNDLCHKACPPKHFPSTALLSIIPDHKLSSIKRGSGRGVNGTGNRRGIDKGDGNDGNDDDDDDDMNDKDEKDEEGDNYSYHNYKKRNDVDSKNNKNRKKTFSEESSKNTRKQLGARSTQLFIDPSTYSTSPINNPINNPITNPTTNPSTHPSNSQSTKPLTNPPSTHLSTNTSTRHSTHQTTSPPNNNFLNPPTTAIYLGEINAGVLMKEGEEILRIPVCSTCHSSCLSCTGNHENDCVKCVGGYYLTTDRRCIPDQGYMNFLQNYHFIIAALSAVVLVVIFVFIIIIICCRRNNSHAYESLKTEE